MASGPGREMTGARRRRLRALMFALVGAGAALIAIGLYAFDALLSDAELDTVNARYELRGERPPPDGIVLASINDETFQRLNEPFPFRRGIYADAIDNARRAGARSIIVDLDAAEDIGFESPAFDRREDRDLQRALVRARDNNVILMLPEPDSDGRRSLIFRPQSLRRSGATVASGVLPADADGVRRRMALAAEDHPTIAVAAAQRLENRTISASDMGGDSTWIDYHGPPGHVPEIPFSALVRGDLEPGELAGRTVIIGKIAPTLQDVFPTATSDENFMPAAEIQANALQTALDDFPLQSSPAWLDILLIALLGMAAPAASLVMRARYVFLIAAGSLVAFVVAAQLAFDAGLVLVVVFPLLAWALAAIGTLLVQLLTNAFEREQVRDMFSRFVPAAVVDDVLKEAGDGLRLGGVRRRSTVLFSDLRGFTSFSEQLEPDQVIEVVNRYLTEMSDAILAHGGTLVAYMGDGIFAVFGAPIEQPDHANRALAAAREMIGPRLANFNNWIKEQNLGDGFRMGIGLNSGDVMSGNVGSLQRVEYAAIGDTTNTAARLEGMTKGTEHMLYISESTIQSLVGEDHTNDIQQVGEFPIRGRKRMITIYSIPDPQTAPPPTTTGNGDRDGDGDGDGG